MSRTQRRIEQHRKGSVCLTVHDLEGRPRAGVPVWAEQESHAFMFGCIAPAMETLREPERRRCEERLAEVFNRIVPLDQPSAPGIRLYEVPKGVPLGRVRMELDRLADAGPPVEVHVRGRSLGLGISAAERSEAERVAALYTLCFAHPLVGGIVWHGFWDGEEGAEGGGLLHRDLSPRPAFHFLRKLLGVVWHSRASGETDAAGRFAFRGFLGDYRVAARRGEEAATTALLSLRGGIETAIRNEPIPIQLSFDGLTIAEAAGSRYT